GVAHGEVRDAAAVVVVVAAAVPVGGGTHVQAFHVGFVAGIRELRVAQEGSVLRDVGVAHDREVAPLVGRYAPCSGLGISGNLRAAHAGRAGPGGHVGLGGHDDRVGSGDVN